MSSVAALIADMVRAGVDPEIIGRTAETIAEASTSKVVRSAGADRQARYRQRNKASQTVTSDESDAAPASLDKESPQTPKEINPNTPPIVPPASKRFADPAIVLQTMVDPLTARNFADHCAQRKPRLTSQSAEGVVRVLRDVAAAGGNPVSALRLAMDRGWGAGFDVDWLRNAGFKMNSAPSKAIDWEGRLRGFREDGFWSPGWGPKPGEPECAAPPDLVRDLAA